MHTHILALPVSNQRKKLIFALPWYVYVFFLPSWHLLYDYNKYHFPWKFFANNFSHMNVFRVISYYSHLLYFWFSCFNNKLLLLWTVEYPVNLSISCLHGVYCTRLSKYYYYYSFCNERLKVVRRYLYGTLSHLCDKF